LEEDEQEDESGSRATKDGLDDVLDIDEAPSVVAVRVVPGSRSSTWRKAPKARRDKCEGADIFGKNRL